MRTCLHHEGDFIAPLSIGLLQRDYADAMSHKAVVFKYFFFFIPLVDICKQKLCLPTGFGGSQLYCNYL
jgi:hypothetical protein